MTSLFILIFAAFLFSVLAVVFGLIKLFGACYA